MKNEHIFNNVRDIGDVLGKVFAKLMKEHGFKMVSKVTPDIFVAVRNIYNFEKDYMIQEAKWKNDLLSTKEQELLAKDQELAFKDKEADSLRQNVESLKQKLTDELTSLAKQKDQELAFKDKEADSLRQNVESLKQKLTDELTSLAKQKDQELAFKDKEADSLRQNVESSKQKLTDELTSLAKQKDQELAFKDKEADSLRQNVESLKQKLTDELTSLAKQKDQELAFKDKEADSLRQNVESLKQKLTDELTSLAKQKDQELAFKEEQISSLKEEKNSLNQKFSEELTSILSAKENEINLLQQQKELELSSTIQKYLKEIELKDYELSLRQQEKDSLKQELSFLKGSLLDKENELTLLADKLSQKEEERALLSNQLSLLQDTVNEARKKNEETLATERAVKEQETSLLKNQIHEREEKINKLNAENAYLNEEKERWQMSANRIRSELDGIYKSTGYRYLLKPLWDFLWVVKNSLKRIIWTTKSILSKFSLNYREFIGSFNRMVHRVSAKIFLILSYSFSLDTYRCAYLNHIRYGTYPLSPVKCTIMLTRKCNLKCKFCDIADVKEKKEILSRDEAFKIIEDIKKLGVKEVIFTGGEPFTHPYIFEIVEFAKLNGLSPTITTNGFMVKENIGKIVTSGVDCICVSVDGNESTHDFLRNREGAHRVALEAVGLLRKNNICTVINFVVTNLNVYELETVYNFFANLEIEVCFLPVVNKLHLFPSKPEEQRIYLNFVKKLYRQKRISEHTFSYLKIAIATSFGNKGRTCRCLGLNSEFGIDTDGNISPCCVWENRKPELNNLGNALHDNIEKLWHSSEFHEARKSIFVDGCKNCFNPSMVDLPKRTGLTFLTPKRYKIEAGALNEEGRALGKKSKPKQVHMRFTSRCNLSCRHCDIWKTKRQKEKELSFEQWKSNIDKLYSWLGSFNLFLAGGEILLYPEAIPIINYCSSKGILVSITTNATLIDDPMAQKLINSGMYCIIMSLDGFSDVHGYIRNNPDAFSKVERAAANLLKYRKQEMPHISISTVITKNNLVEIPELIKLLQRWGINSISFQALDHNFDAPYNKNWFESNEFWPDDYHKLKGTVDHLIAAKKSGIPIGNSLAQLDDIKRYYKNPLASANVPCLTGLNNFIVTEFADVLLCWNMEAIGNLLLENPEEIWNSDMARKTRERIAKCHRTCRMLNCNYA